MQIRAISGSSSSPRQFFIRRIFADTAVSSVTMSICSCGRECGRSAEYDCTWCTSWCFPEDRFHKFEGEHKSRFRTVVMIAAAESDHSDSKRQHCTSTCMQTCFEVRTSVSKPVYWHCHWQFTCFCVSLCLLYVNLFDYPHHNLM